MSNPERAPATATLLAKVKRQAKQDAKASGLPHTHHLEAAALAAGYASFHELQQACSATHETGPIPLDPKLPELFDSTPNEERSLKELDTWWDRPFAISLEDGKFEVRCLDGGAWDRSTWYGIAGDLEAAARLGTKKLAAWRVFRGAVAASWRGDGRVDVVRMPQRPDQDVEVLYEAKDGEDAATWMAHYNAQATAGTSNSSVSSNSDSGNEAGASTRASL